MLYFFDSNTLILKHKRIIWELDLSNKSLVITINNCEFNFSDSGFIISKAENIQFYVIKYILW